MSGSDPSSGRIVLQQLQFVQQLYNPPPDLRREPPLHKGALIRRYREYLKHTVQLRSYSLPPWSRLRPRMTGQSTVPIGWRRDEGVPALPKRNITPAKNLSYSNEIPLGGRGRPPLPVFTSITVVRRLPLFYNCFRPLKRCGVRDTAARR